MPLDADTIRFASLAYLCGCEYEYARAIYDQWTLCPDHAHEPCQATLVMRANPRADAILTRSDDGNPDAPHPSSRPARPDHAKPPHLRVVRNAPQGVVRGEPGSDAGPGGGPGD